jgi:hypothetical protein
MTMGAILALDLGIQMGWCQGPSNSGSVRLRAPGAPEGVAEGNLIAWLHGHLYLHSPEVVVKESPLSLQGFANTHNSQEIVERTYGLHRIVLGMCNRFGIRCESVHPSTYRKHFIGRANCGARQDTKAAVIERCHLLKYLPRGCIDEDRADACAIWDWATAHFGRRRHGAKDLHLFGESVEERIGT